MVKTARSATVLRRLIIYRESRQPGEGGEGVERAEQQWRV